MGALLLLAWLGETLRPTRDADLLGFGNLEDNELLKIFGEICTIHVEPDATMFGADSIAIDSFATQLTTVEIESTFAHRLELPASVFRLISELVMQ